MAAELEELTTSQGWVDELAYTAEKGGQMHTSWQDHRKLLMQYHEVAKCCQVWSMRFAACFSLRHVFLCSLALEGPQLCGQLRLCGKVENRVLGSYKQPSASTPFLHETSSKFVVLPGTSVLVVTFFDSRQQSVPFVECEGGKFSFQGLGACRTSESMLETIVLVRR